MCRRIRKDRLYQLGRSWADKKLLMLIMTFISKIIKGSSLCKVNFNMLNLQNWNEKEI